MKAIIIGDKEYILKESPFKCKKEHVDKGNMKELKIYISANSDYAELVLTFEQSYDCTKMIRFLYDSKKERCQLYKGYERETIGNIEIHDNY